MPLMKFKKLAKKQMDMDESRPSSIASEIRRRSQMERTDAEAPVDLEANNADVSEDDYDELNEKAAEDGQYDLPEIKQPMDSNMDGVEDSALDLVGKLRARMKSRRGY